ncbi:MAG: hypothetical protein HYU25_14370 [Candidatus Rokubacteria bacterium]|nr:hypothetical protein [Candidatus Rokubacteria bacterium]
MSRLWSSRWSVQFIVAVATMVALMLLVVIVSEGIAGHAVAAESQIAWKAHLEKVEDAVSRNDLAQAVMLWREAYAAALRSRHWEGLLAVAEAYRRLGGLAGFGRASEAKARQIYLAALFRARQEGSLDGVLRVAEAFADLGDREIVDRCIAIARTMAVQARDARAEHRVRVFAERWAAHKLEVEKQNGSGKVAR